MSNAKVAASRPRWLSTGWLWGFGGVLGFSLTLPATQVAVPWFGSTVVSFGRAAFAGILACALLWIRRERIPFEHWKSLLWISAGVVVGFPFFSAWAMERTPASHGAVMLAILPLAASGGVDWSRVPLSAWMSGLYVSIGSQWLLFFAWYYGLASGGVARVSQLQYLQVFLTLAWSALWLRETVTPVMGLAALLVVAAVAWAPVSAAKGRPERDSG